MKNEVRYGQCLAKPRVQGDHKTLYKDYLTEKTLFLIIISKKLPVVGGELGNHCFSPVLQNTKPIRQYKSAPTSNNFKPIFSLTMI